MADYNVNMKQWNGTSFDNVLPLAYNAKQLEGQSLAEVKQWVQDNGLLLYTGQYTGTGMYGVNNPTSITFPFEPIVLIGPIEVTSSKRTINISKYMKTSYEEQYWFYYYVYLKISADRKTISWYSDSDADQQFNTSGLTYYFAAIGGYDMGGATEWIITSSGTWIVPRTGRYYLELYGGGGGLVGLNESASGGSSCQSYNFVSLTKGDSISVSLGTGGGMIGETTRVATGTTFGSYSVAGAKNSVNGTAGAGAGNLGTDGKTGLSSTMKNPSSGKYGDTYGYGINYRYGGNGAVYLKYLGA